MTQAGITGEAQRQLVSLSFEAIHSVLCLVSPKVAQRTQSPRPGYVQCPGNPADAAEYAELDECGHIVRLQRIAPAARVFVGGVTIKLCSVAAFRQSNRRARRLLSFTLISITPPQLLSVVGFRSDNRLGMCRWKKSELTGEILRSTLPALDLATNYVSPRRFWGFSIRKPLHGIAC